MKTNKNKFENLVRANVNKGVTKKEDKKAGVIQTIIDILSKEAHTKDSLLAELKRYFPEREESSLKSTLKAQFAGKNGTRLEKERGIELKYINKRFQVKLLNISELKVLKIGTKKTKKMKNNKKNPATNRVFYMYISLN